MLPDRERCRRRRQPRRPHVLVCRRRTALRQERFQSLVSMDTSAEYFPTLLLRATDRECWDRRFPCYQRGCRRCFHRDESTWPESCHPFVVRVPGSEGRIGSTWHVNEYCRPTCSLQER